jgi:hypothetical protein
VRAPRPDPESVAEAFPLLGAAMESAADNAPIEERSEPVFEDVRIPAPPSPEPLAAPLLELPPVPSTPEPVAQPEPASAPPPLFVAALSQPAMPAPMTAPEPPRQAPAAPQAAPAYSLLESLGRQTDLTPSLAAAASVPTQGAYAASAGPSPSGTFASLLAAAPSAAGGWGSAPGTALRSGSLLPAAAVTVPLSEVLRLIAVGAPNPSSPFDAFRAALHAPGSR